MKSTTKSEQPIISNGFVTCYSDHLVIHLYYFPYGNKTIKYSDIQSCELLKLCDLSILKYKAWGMALSSIWWHSDFHRSSREYYIILDTNNWPKIGITMNDNDIINVYELIKQKTGRNQSFDSTGKLDANMINSMSEKKFEYQNSLENNRAKYMN
jgi:hypothetical protein